VTAGRHRRTAGRADLVPADHLHGDSRGNRIARERDLRPGCRCSVRTPAEAVEKAKNTPSTVGRHLDRKGSRIYGWRRSCGPALYWTKTFKRPPHTPPPFDPRFAVGGTSSRASVAKVPPRAEGLSCKLATRRLKFARPTAVYRCAFPGSEYGRSYPVTGAKGRMLAQRRARANQVRKCDGRGRRRSARPSTEGRGATAYNPVRSLPRGTRFRGSARQFAREVAAASRSRPGRQRPRSNAAIVGGSGTPGGRTSSPRRWGPSTRSRDRTNFRRRADRSGRRSVAPQD